MQFAKLLKQQTKELRKLIKEQDEFYKHFQTKQDKVITNWTNNSKH